LFTKLCRSLVLPLECTDHYFGYFGLSSSTGATMECEPSRGCRVNIVSGKNNSLRLVFLS
jgi:hypothetical protein